MLAGGRAASRLSFFSDKKRRFHSQGTAALMKKLGFERVSSSGTAFIGKNQVIKICLFCSNIKNVPKEFRVPTEVVVEDWEMNLVIQPKASIPDLKTSKNIVFEMEREHALRYVEDIHDGNVGVYEGKNVLIDW